MGALLWVCLSLQVEPPVPAPWTVKAELSVVEKDGEHVFIIRGTTDLPSGVDLRARVYAVQVVEDPRVGKREDEEPIVWGDENQPALKPVHIRDGRFNQEVYRFTRVPWPIRYRARLHYDAGNQTDAILDKLGRKDWSAPADYRLGTENQFAERLARNVKDITRDVLTLQELHKDFKTEFAAQRTGFDATRWKTWKVGWYERVERLEGLNERRWSMWAVFLDRLAKMSIGSMCELHRRALVGAGKYFTDESLTAEQRTRELERVEEIIDALPDILAQSIDQMGINIPLDKDVVGPILRAYDAALEPLRNYVESGQGDPAKVRAQVRSAGLRALFGLTPHLKNRKLAYTEASGLSIRFRAMLDLLEKGASRETLKDALAGHDEVYGKFKTFAGVK